MKDILGPGDFTFEVTIGVDDGQVQRVTFRKADMPLTKLPRMNLRLQKFLDLTPTQEEEDYTAVAWSFDAGERKCMQVEKVYHGRLGLLVDNTTKTGTHA